jgi:hypothetical protein
MQFASDSAEHARRSLSPLWQKAMVQTPFCIVGVSGPVHGDKHFLADILKLSAIYHMPAQEARYQRADFLKEDMESLTISISSTVKLRSAHVPFGRSYNS